MKIFNYMEYIYTVYRERSFTRAAEKLYISQPSLSLTIKKIEKDIGYPLFERCGKEVRLTAIGEKYINAIEEINRISFKLSNEVDDLLKLKKGSITLGSTTFIASFVLPDILKMFKNKYPDVDINIVVEQSTALEEKLEGDLVDIVVDNATSIQRGYNYERVLSEKILIAVPKDLPVNRELCKFAVTKESIKQGTVDYKRHPRVKISEFKDEKFILLKKGNKMRQIAHKIFEESGIYPSIAMEFDELHTSFSYAESGFGVCFLSDIAIKYSMESDNLRFYLPDTDNSERPLYVINKKSKYLTSAAAELVEFIKTNAKS